MVKIKIQSIVVTALAAVSLSSCGLYTKFEHTADSEIVENLYDYIEASSDTTTLASKSWQELFTDPHLQSLIEQGLEQNSDLRVAKLNVEQSQIALSTARLAYLPSLGAEAGASFKSGSSPSYTLSLASSWQIDLFGKLTNAKWQQKAALEQSEAYSQAVQTELIASIANSYYSLLLLDKQIEISSSSLKAWEANIRSVEALNRAGRVNITSVLQAKANKEALQSNIISLQEQVSELENTLSVLLLSTPRHIERGSLDALSFDEQIAVGVPLQLVSNRPDVRVAEYNLSQAYYATNIARASLYPSITLGGSASYSADFGTTIDPSEVIYSAVASVLQPIFYQRSLRAAVKISKAQQEQALLQFNQTLLDAGAEVNLALVNWQSANKRSEHYTSQIELLSQALKSSELLMKHGSVNYLEVLTAQQTLLSAELNFSANQYNKIQSVIDLYRSLGGGR